MRRLETLRGFSRRASVRRDWRSFGADYGRTHELFSQATGFGAVVEFGAGYKCQEHRPAGAPKRVLLDVEREDNFRGGSETVP